MYSTRYFGRILMKRFLDRFSKKSNVSNFIKIRLVEAELFHADGHDEANSRF